MHIPGRTFVVSGGCSGLGQACVRLLHNLGGSIAILDLDASKGEQLAQELEQSQRESQGRVKFFEVDVSETESIQHAVRGITEWVKSTGHELGGVIPAAGVGLPGKVLDRSDEPISLDSIDYVLNINLRGTLDLIRQLIPHIAKNKPLSPDLERGVLVLVSSTAAFEGQIGQLAYSASKGALASVTLVLARDLASHGIRCVTIAPSLFETNMTAMMGDKVRKGLESVLEFPKRGGNPEEFASLVREIIENKMLNGTVIRLDGGTRMPSRL
ncbi:3-hydroxyacyl-CoA dehydrogenase type-2 [Viridothelium virens]|uniref:3-hydroxyacyl-CoA dehydrogenase type-2 n=1 Tax=Viridothelium virens TaxID=1048519 RepID=A0A6A6H7J9_VIRVR|nr:3-hydroxyacyl-CoA dehydrogenase type-2 [Viridothelium virens]